MVATCAVSGSGKTTLAGKVAAALGGIRLRSDVERKRVVGMAATDRPPDAAAAAALYSEEASRRTYERLAELARETLGAGTSVVVDAACLRRRERRVLAAAAAATGAPLVWLLIDVPEPIVLERVARRQAAGHDASDADGGVVRHQFARREPLEPAEFGTAASPGAGERVVRVGPDDLGDPGVVGRIVAGLAEPAGPRARAEMGRSG
jgi:predicted kinase